MRRRHKKIEIEKGTKLSRAVRRRQSDAGRGSVKPRVMRSHAVYRDSFSRDARAQRQCLALSLIVACRHDERTRARRV